MGSCQIDKDSPVIVLDVEIEGKIKAIAKMALDTGATYVMIPWEIAEILGLRPEISEEKVEILTASGVEKAPLATLNSVKVLGEEANHVKAVVHNLPQKSYVDGLLGLSFLKNFSLHVGFKEGILRIE